MSRSKEALAGDIPPRVAAILAGSIIPGMAEEYSRWRNCQEPGTMFFVTTTVLGYDLP
jgi:hypothetical protein